MNRARLSVLLFTLVGLFTIVSPYVFDWNKTHVFNPLWPPHAKFHEGQTLSMGVLLGLATLLFTYRRGGDRAGNLLAGSLFAGFYWISQAAAGFYPGAAWTDPEFLKPGQSLHQFAPQNYVEIVVLALIVGAAWLGSTASRPDGGRGRPAPSAALPG